MWQTLPIVIRRGFRFKLKAPPKIQTAFRTMAGHARFVWNKAARPRIGEMTSPRRRAGGESLRRDRALASP